jgi:predicted ABC-type ATPase
MPVVTVVAGPNGAGKSTIINEFAIEGIGNLLDTDAIAKALNPNDPLQAAFLAGREVIERTRKYIENRESFVLETTLSGNAAVSAMRSAKAAGFVTNLVYVYLDAPELSMKRVRERAAQGGHFVPDDDVLRRYRRSLFHLSQALPLADRAVVLDNSGAEPQELLQLTAGVVVFCRPNLPRPIQSLLDRLLP